MKCDCVCGLALNLYELSALQAAKKEEDETRVLRTTMENVREDLPASKTSSDKERHSSVSTLKAVMSKSFILSQMTLDEVTK